MTLFPLEAARFGRSLFVCALLLAFPISAALNLEGMTGYWMVPTAWTLPEKGLALSGNVHQNDPGNKWNEPRNLELGFAPFPHMELVGRFGFPDLSYNGKIGWAFEADRPWATGLAVGIEDFTGGAQFFHSDYLVATQRLWRLEATLGWGTGPRSGNHLNTPHLDGIFWGASLDLLPPGPGPEATLLHDDDGHAPHTGLRIGWNGEDWSAHGDLSRAWEQERWDASFQLEHRLPPPTPLPNLSDSLALVRLRFGPWMQSFLGTEVGNFDAQVALDAQGIVEPWPEAWVGSLLRTRLWYSENFASGHAFANYRQEPAVWLEAGGAGFHLPTRSPWGAWLQGGFLDGSWIGGAMELLSAPLIQGVRVGGFAGAWHSNYWHHDRQMLLPCIDWDSPSRTWFARFDAGRYWGQDEGMRLWTGMRFGRFALSALVGHGSGANVVGARMEMDLAGIGWKPTSWLSLEPTPRWQHGLSTVLATGDGEYNYLHPTTLSDAPLFASGRYQTWP